VLTDVANELRDRGAFDEEECFIDATLVMAKAGGADVGATKRGKGLKIMAIVDRHGRMLPTIGCRAELARSRRRIRCTDKLPCYPLGAAELKTKLSSHVNFARENGLAARSREVNVFGKTGEFVLGHSHGWSKKC